MEQRAPGHTVADGKIYRKGLLDFKADIAEAIAALDFDRDPEALDKREALRAMALSCDAVMRLGRALCGAGRGPGRGVRATRRASRSC